MFYVYICLVHSFILKLNIFDRSQNNRKTCETHVTNWVAYWLHSATQNLQYTAFLKLIECFVISRLELKWISGGVTEWCYWFCFECARFKKIYINLIHHFIAVITRLINELNLYQILFVGIRVQTQSITQPQKSESSNYEWIFVVWSPFLLLFHICK